MKNLIIGSLLLMSTQALGSAFVVECESTPQALQDRIQATGFKFPVDFANRVVGKWRTKKMAIPVDVNVMQHKGRYKVGLDVEVPLFGIDIFEAQNLRLCPVADNRIIAAAIIDGKAQQIDIHVKGTKKLTVPKGDLKGSYDKDANATNKEIIRQFKDVL